MRGLPDTASVRQVAMKVAEVDHHARCSAANILVRCFRELMSVTGDDAISGTRNWRNLTRNEKLARFGWVVKEQEPLDDRAEPLI